MIKNIIHCRHTARYTACHMPQTNMKEFRNIYVQYQQTQTIITFVYYLHHFFLNYLFGVYFLLVIKTVALPNLYYTKYRV